MIYVLTDNSGYQTFPRPKNPNQYIEVQGALEESIVGGHPYEVKDGEVRLLNAAVVEQQKKEREIKNTVVTRYQLMAALQDLKLLGKARSGMQSASEASQLAWQELQKFKRDSNVIQELTTAVNVTSTEMNNIFRNAKEIQE